MKNLSVLLIALMITSVACGQKNEIPSLVKTAFQKLQPSVSKVKWEKEKENYEANFELNEKDYSMVLDASGNLLETEMEMDLNELPNPIKVYVNQNYPKMKIKEIAKMITNQGLISYEVELKDKELVFDEQGTFLKEVKE